MPTDGLLPASATISVFASFRAFWNEVEAAKALAVSGSVPGPSDEPALTHAGTAVRTRLLTMLKAQEAEVTRVAHGAALQTYRDAAYLMAALADDVFVRLPWGGASWWLWNPLETALFGTRCAGDRVFERIERLTTGADPSQRELAAVYLAALALGFQGRYAGQADFSAIADYTRQLRVFIFGDQEDIQGPLVPECYAHTDAHGRGARLRRARVWWWAALVILGVWLAGSTAAWRRATDPIAADAARVEAALAEQGEGRR